MKITYPVTFSTEFILDKMPEREKLAIMAMPAETLVEMLTELVKDVLAPRIAEVNQGGSYSFLSVE